MSEETDKVLSASRDGDIQTLQSFRRSVPFAFDSFGATALHHAARNGKLECIKWMIERVGMKAKVKAKNGATPLHDACTQGKLLCVKYFIQDCKLNPDAIDNSGHTPLHLAARFGYLDIVKWLITKANCNPRLKTMNRMNAVHFAAAGGHLHCLEFLISSGNTILLDEKATDGTTPVFITTQNGHFPCLKYLHTVGAKCDLRSRDGMHLIHAAAQNGHLDCIGYLVINGLASEKEGDSTGATPAHYAAGEGHVPILKWLNKRCDINIKDQLGGTPLHDASEKGQLAAIQYLVENAHLSTKLKDKSSLTPIDLADKYGHKRCHEYLRDAASKSNQVRAAKLMSYSNNFDKQTVEDSSGSSFLHVLKKKPRQMDRPPSPKSAKGPNIPPLDIPPEVSPRNSPIPCMIEYGKTSEWDKVNGEDLSEVHPHNTDVERSIENQEENQRSHLLDTSDMRALSPLNDEFWANKNGSVTPTLNVDAFSHNAAGARRFDDRPDEELTEEMLEAAKTRTQIMNARIQNPTPSPLERFDPRSEEMDAKHLQDFSSQINAARAKRSPHNTPSRNDYHTLVIEQNNSKETVNGKTDDKETPMECSNIKASHPPKTLTDIFNNTNKDPSPDPVTSQPQTARPSPVKLPPQQSIQSRAAKSPSPDRFQPIPVDSRPPQSNKPPKSPSPHNTKPIEIPETKASAPPSPPPQFKDRPASPPQEQPPPAQKSSNPYAATPLVPVSQPAPNRTYPEPKPVSPEPKPASPMHKDASPEPKPVSPVHKPVSPVPKPLSPVPSHKEKEPEVDENEQPIDEENYMTTDDEREEKTVKEKPQKNKEDVPLRKRQLQPLPHMNGTNEPLDKSPISTVDQETWATLPEWKRQVLRNRIMKEQQTELHIRKQEEEKKSKYAEVPSWKVRKEFERTNEENQVNTMPEWKKQLILKKKLKENRI